MPPLCRPRARDQFVFDVVIGCDEMDAQQGQAKMYQPGTVALRFVGNRTDQGAARLRYLLQGFWNTVLTHNGYVFLSLQFAHRFYCAQGARIGGGSNQNSAILRVTAQKIEHQLVALVPQPTGVHTHEEFSWN